MPPRFSQRRPAHSRSPGSHDPLAAPHGSRGGRQPDRPKFQVGRKAPCSSHFAPSTRRASQGSLTTSCFTRWSWSRVSGKEIVLFKWEQPRNCGTQKGKNKTRPTLKRDVRTNVETLEEISVARARARTRRRARRRARRRLTLEPASLSVCIPVWIAVRSEDGGAQGAEQVHPAGL